MYKAVASFLFTILAFTDNVHSNNVSTESWNVQSNNGSTESSNVHSNNRSSENSDTVNILDIIQSKLECLLPDCYLQHDRPPGGLTPRDSPQILHFTFTGAVTQEDRDALTEIFPSSVKNPNGCPVSITFFIVSQGSDDCLIHRLYTRGHEIALAGMNRTGATTTNKWEQQDWERSIEEQRVHLVDKANIPGYHILGMRAQRQKSGGDNQFRMLSDLGYLYDSSLLAGPYDKLDNSGTYPWPFTLDESFEDLGFKCLIEPCPTEAYPNFWEIPLVPLIGSSRPCAYLDDCISRMKGSEAVADFLNRQFRDTYYNKRTPMQVNLQPKTMRSKFAVEGLKKFVQQVVGRDDTWIITMQETIAWMQDPVDKYSVEDKGVWGCSEKREYTACTAAGANKTRKHVTLREIMDVDQIWIWQTVVLVVLYVVFFRYDRMIQAEKKKR